MMQEKAIKTQQKNQTYSTLDFVSFISRGTSHCAVIFSRLAGKAELALHALLPNSYPGSGSRENGP